MVKGISRQVIVVHSPDQKLFDQAIFILNDDVIDRGGVTDEMLLKEADKLLRSSATKKTSKLYSYGAFWASAGALTMGMIWLLISFL